MTHPLLLEINARCWLRELSANDRPHVSLANVPESVFEEWARMGLSHVWLMGAWTTGPASRGRALSHASLRREFDLSLPGWQEEDVPGSPYAIARYEVPLTLGGDQGLRVFREKLHEYGLGLLLDFVPNHVGLDHPWIDESPDRFITSPADHPHSFYRETCEGGRWVVHGKDPYFDPWDDTAQLDYRRPEVHEAMIAELLGVARKCDGVRCDMAMLLLQDVFERSWADFPIPNGGGTSAAGEFWEGAITRTRERFPGFLFLAEAYWNLEGRLQHLGFDFTYDKFITDVLLQRRSRDLTHHVLTQPADFIGRSAHFLENHDEIRVASVLSIAEHRAAALAILALPGMRLLHEGQTQGARIRTPVQLGARMKEPVDPEVEGVYVRLFHALKRAHIGHGPGEILRPQPAWPGNPTAGNILAIQWGEYEKGLVWVIVNLAGHRSQCRLPFASIPRAGGAWVLTDLLSSERWIRSSSELQQPGLFLDLGEHATHIFLVQPHTDSE